MIAPKRLERLHRIRQLEEGQARIAVEAAATALRTQQSRMDSALRAERESRQSRNRVLEVEIEARREDLEGQWWLSEAEAQIGQGMAVRMACTIPELDTAVEVCRAEFLSRRQQRQKVEVLLDEAVRRERTDAIRRSGAELDDIFLTRRMHSKAREDRDASQNDAL